MTQNNELLQTNSKSMNTNSVETHQHGEQDHHHETIETRGGVIRWASFYDTLVWLLSLGKEKLFRQQIIALAHLKPGDKVLDVGCGTGNLALLAKKQVAPTGEVYGTDASPEMIDMAQQKAVKAGVKVIFQVDLIEHISFPDNQFDVVLSSFMMHHLPNDLKQKGLAEIYRVLKPGGRLLIVDMQSSANGSVFQRFSDFMIQLHGGHTVMQNNVTKLTPLMETAQFKNIKTENINRQLSAISGQKAATF